MTDRSTVTSSTVTGSAAGVITRRTLPAPAGVTVYELTGAGRALQPALTELLHWGLRYAPEPSPGDAAQPGWALLAAAGRPTALPAGQTCELRVGAEFFYLGSDAGTLTVRRGPAPDGDAVVTMSAGTFYGLLTGQVTVTGAVRHATVDGEPGIARRALEPLAAAGTPRPPGEAPGRNQAAPLRQQINLGRNPHVRNTIQDHPGGRTGRWCTSSRPAPAWMRWTRRLVGCGRRACPPGTSGLRGGRRRTGRAGPDRGPSR